jgi:hypothetical protein
MSLRSCRMMQLCEELCTKTAAEALKRVEREKLHKLQDESRAQR